MWSTAELELQLKDWIWEKRGIGEDLQLAYLWKPPNNEGCSQNYGILFTN